MRKNIISLVISLFLFGAFAPCVYARDDQPLTLREAMELARQGKTDEAVSAIKKILEKDPDAENGGARFKLGIVYFKSNQYDSALAEFQKIIAARADTALAYYFTGLIYEKTAVNENDRVAARQKKQRALESWEKFIQYAGEKKEPYLSHHHRNLGITVEESISRAKKHVELLREDLLNE